MYDDRMRRAFHSLQHHCPPNFGVDLIDNEDFITIRIPSYKLKALNYDDQVTAVAYVIKVKKAFEDLGAIVLVTRTAIDNS
jgi:hypothetical protein